MRMRMWMLRRTDSKTGKHTVHQPSQSKCTWTFEKGHVVWKFTGNVPDAHPGQGILRGLAQAKRTWTVTRATLCRNLQENAGRYSRALHFVRACTIEMHMDMSQEPLCVEIYSKNAGRQSRQPFCASLRSRNAHGHFTRAILCRNLHEKKPRRVGYHLD